MRPDGREIPIKGRGKEHGRGTKEDRARRSSTTGGRGENGTDSGSAEVGTRDAALRDRWTDTGVHRRSVRDEGDRGSSGYPRPGTPSPPHRGGAIRGEGVSDNPPR